MIGLQPPHAAITDGVLHNHVLTQDCSQGSSLQDSFLRFRDQKKKERQILKLSRDGELNGGGERTDMYKDALREKFINTAKKYIGVPYAERYKADDVPVAPLYLDCCALVRRAVTDLQDEFGIVLGKWNQAYQMDTLPIILQESDLKPGDLIFYEGLYTSPRSKSQKHNNVHVEIFLGGETGEATIGSRFSHGNVGIFPSYKFTSTKWTLVQYHFRSLDTWLNGECRSHCAEHKWHSDLLGIEAAAGRRSIFDDHSDDESAGGSSKNDDDDGANSGSEVDEAVGLTCVSTSVPNSSCHSTDLAVAATVDDLKPSKILAGNVSDSKSGSLPRKKFNKTSTKQSNKSSSPKCLHQRPKSADVGDSAVIISSPSPTKRLVPRSSGSIVGKRGGVAREDLGLVMITGSTAPVQRRLHSISHDDMQVKESSVPKDKDKETDKEKSSVPYTYYVGKSNGWRLLKDSLDRRGWQQLPFEYSFSSRFNLKWVERRSQIDYRAHTPGQLVNHIPNNDCISTKLGLLLTLREKYCKVPPSCTVRKPTPWLPETYQLDSPADVIAMFEVENQLSKDKLEKKGSLNNNKIDVEVDGDGGCLWIYKPSCNNRGRGIKVLKGKESLSLICYGKNTNDPLTTILPSPGILQRYVENPLLVGVEQLKFDVRCYMLVARNDPSYTAYYHPGYCILSLKKYSTSLESLEDPTVHLTNASIQKKDLLYEMNKELQVLSIFYFYFTLLLDLYIYFISNNI